MIEGQRKNSNFIIKENLLYGDFMCIGACKINGERKYIMECQKCGKIKYMLKSTIRLNKGLSHKSCGKGLGVTKNPAFYKRWQAMRARTSPTSIHHNVYYDRGINSDEFSSFIDFYNAMYSSWLEHVAQYGEENTSLERIDVNKPYTKDNCKWVTFAEQKENMQKTIYFTVEDLDTKEIKYCKDALKYAKENYLPTYIAEVINNGRTYLNKKYTRITKEEYDNYISQQEV